MTPGGNAVVPDPCFWCEQAWLPGGVRAAVAVRVGPDGRIAGVQAGAHPPAGAQRLAGLVLPGAANTHSHAFHRALRGRTHGTGGTFWTWRRVMYELAGRLDPERYHRLAVAAYAEMVVAGWTCVGEFHYLHHAPGGRRYASPTAMADALRAAATRAGIRLTLLDTCYLAGGIGRPLEPEQLRFGDGSVTDWAARLDAHPADSTSYRTGAAIHSVRAVPRAALPEVVAAAGTRPLHVHLAEQPAEDAGCRAAYGMGAVELLGEAGALRPATTAVHAVHLSAGDIESLGAAGVTVAACPNTEADLADGIGPFAELAAAGCPLALGSDQHAVVDPFAEARALEHGQRLRSVLAGTGRRGRFTPAGLLTAMTAAGHAALGWPGNGVIAPGAAADLVAVRTATPRTAGCLPEQLPLAATASDIDTVVVGGRIVAGDGQHAELGDPGALLHRAVREAWS
ncbi:MAG: formimidoylglutamate deiminase [Pseudonocardiaceae bacterium]